MAKDKLVRDVECEIAEQAAERARQTIPSFRQVAHAYLQWLSAIKDAKPSTLRDHQYLLAEPGAAHRRGKDAHGVRCVVRRSSLESR